MFHVIHITSSTGYYGAERVIVELASGIKSRGWQTMIVNLGDRGEDLLEASRRVNVPAVALKCRGRYDQQAVRLLCQLAAEERAPLTHSHGYKADLYAFWARTPASGLIATCHNWPGSNVPLKIYGWLDRCILKRFDRAAAVSEDVAGTLRKAGIGTGKISCIPNGITPVPAAYVHASQRLRARGELGIKKGQRVALSVGRLSPEKGFEGLIRAWPGVRAAAGPAKLIIAGGGPLHARLEQLIKAEGLDGAVVLGGVRQDIPVLLSISDLFIMPSLTEGIPLALLEAMASRTPVVASRSGGIPFVTGNDALLVDPGNPAALAAGIIQAFNYPGHVQAMALRAEKRFLTRFTASIMVEKYMSLYDEVLAARGIDVSARVNPPAAETVR